MEKYQGSDQKKIDSELTALLTEELIGNEQFIDKVVAEQPNIAMRIVKKIQNLIKLFKMSGEKRAEYKVLTLAENMYLRSAYDHGRQNLIQIIEQGREDNKQVQVYEQNAEVGVDQTLALQYNSDEIQLSRKVDRKPPTEHEFTRYDHGTLRARVMKKNSEGTGLYPIDFDRTANHFVVYYNNGSDSYKIIKTFDLEIYDDILDELEENIKNGKIYRTSKDLRTDISRFRIEKRRSSNSDDTITGRKPNGENGGLHRGESESNRIGHSQKSSRYKRAVVDYHFNDDGSQIVTYSDGTKKKSYSLKDSQGNELTQQQAEYFRDSKVRDEQGNLLVVYHGSKAIFTKFDANKIGWNGKAEGHGFYFTDNKNFAEDYSDVNGQLLQGYLNIKKPLSNSKRTLTRKQIEKLIREIDPTGDDLLSNYSITNIRDYGTSRHSIWYESALKDALNLILPSVDTDSDVLAELINSGAGAEQVLKIAYDNFGYDGYIVKNKYKDTNVFVAFDSSQFKNIDNLTPTSDQDIRYSLKGISKDGIEIYETSEEIRKLPYKERKELFLRKFTEEYKGRTAKFTRNGHSYYATFDYHDINKNINGDRRSDNKGYRAKISAGADGDIFEIIENAQYNGSKPEVGNKKSAAHKNVNYWDYFIKTIQIDGIVFDLVVNIRKKTDSQYVYSIQLRENKKVVSSPLIEVMTDKSAPSLNRVLNDTTNNSISQNIENATFLEEKNIKLSRKSPAPSQVGDIIKARGNLTTDKIFTKDEAKKIIAEIEERLVFVEKGMVGTVKGTNELIDQLWKGLNKANKGEYTRVGVEIADYVINHTVVEDIYEALSGDVEVEEARQVIKTLKQYFHKVKISDRVLGEIKYHFDKSTGKVLSLWRAKEGGLADKINNDTKSQTVLAFFLQ